MSIPPPQDGPRPTARAQQRAEILDWLLRGTLDMRYLDDIFVEFCRRVAEAGVPVARATVYLRTHHPLWLGTRILWRTGLKEAETTNFDYGIVDTSQFKHSPAAEIHAGADEVRQRLDEADHQGNGHALYDELRGEGLTDYVAWPLLFTLGKRHIVTFAADRAGGFAEDELAMLAALVPALAVVSEVRHKNRLTRLLLDTYVGPHASELILNGATRRGSGVTVEAAILVIDLRGFTEISELWPRDDVIALLNDYFDAISLPIERHGGEILKFMGDGLLAIFHLDTPAACTAAQAAAWEAHAAMLAFNEQRSAAGLRRLGYGIGVNVGAVMYGNIGSRTRLDFTIIGPAVNVAARLESLTKVLDVTVLFSGAFVARSQDGHRLARLGTFPLRGVGDPLEVYGFPSEVADSSTDA
ncbi:adenylate/guanylate cyclase domain-containing protein [Methylobacterium sp. BTF04]|uniref:adenylate/guanylate cyclase domain-containing protein n=1 Tax=Methylobacterium sp. BTF04 TaxID=2708300 RepID=UPI0013D8A6DD|nr:adenylate/guanylate cyclase domain-containing protein [Methylobacterium sp. BTF04]NEU14087.1 adenylate/guanylate cyclase domain-containing protein [Methylobacterium sp. BTF04]